MMESEQVVGMELGFNQLLSEKLSDQETSVLPSSVLALRPLGLNALMRLVWVAGIRSVLPEGRPVPGAATGIPNTKRAETIVRAGLACIAENVRAFPSLCKDELWSGSRVVADLSSDERLCVETLFPFFVACEVGKSLVGKQLALSF